ncbi:MAG TPA: DNA-directed RNA polymerase subunit alpha, partial [Rikenellaceae bacterium]|nr:DNA-directed RNA polymerase subunit alpha [Rikenellaceae bacterium]
ATTIGNALRRILLSSLEGYALTYVRIDGVEHEFATIPGVMENVVDIILNLKQVRFKRMIEDMDEETVRVTVKGKETFVTEDISRQLSSFKVLNSDFVICNMDPSVTLSMELHIGKGRGYVPAEENRMENAPLG